MTEYEILASFKQADNKDKQITILSELNDCSREQICEVLKSAGWKQVGNKDWIFLEDKTAVKEKSTMKKRNVRPTKEQLKKAYIDDKLSAKECAEKFNMDYYSLKNLLHTYDLRRTETTVSTTTLSDYAKSILKEYDKQIALAEAEVTKLKISRDDFIASQTAKTIKE